MIGLRLKYKIEPLYSDAVFFIKSLSIFRIGCDFYDKIIFVFFVEY